MQQTPTMSLDSSSVPSHIPIVSLGATSQRIHRTPSHASAYRRWCQFVMRSLGIPLRQSAIVTRPMPPPAATDGLEPWRLHREVQIMRLVVNALREDLRVRAAKQRPSP